ncbi:YlbG family protein [Salirhabdus sp. Marseille-P4669]|uniref:YlbG family protein n=1 Tax=Salirhabdus sp. Marseille-P4669 TaxID=2042310 RepID=UPI000C7E118A|nr:DUF2129 domain-containing protein [Salirhabdus sp. Marseille-P4669]
MWTSRQGMVIWLKNMKYVRKLRKYGHMIYASKNQKYIVIYTNQEGIEEVKSQIEGLPFVAKVDLSFKPFIKTEYEKVSHDKSKEFDYKYDL